MPLLHSLRDAEYLPDYGMVVVRDGLPVDEIQTWTQLPLLDEHEGRGDPIGTLARAGAGWLYLSVIDDYQDVRVEVHDAPPPDDAEAWPDVMETPYLCASGSVALAFLTGGTVSRDLPLPRPGRHRVGVARRQEAGAYVCRLQFWPERTPEPPRWIRRSVPALADRETGWNRYLPYEVHELTWLVPAVGDSRGATPDQIRHWALEHGRPAGWFDESPFAPPPARGTKGHADLDQEEQANRRAQLAELARRQELVADIARQLAVPVPRTRREMLDLFVAVGLLQRSDDRYQVSGHPPRVQDVLELPPDRVDELEGIDDHQRYGALVTDLIALLSWQGGTVRALPVELAERLAVTTEELQAMLTSRSGQVAVEVVGTPEGAVPLVVRLRDVTGSG